MVDIKQFTPSFDPKRDSRARVVLHHRDVVWDLERLQLLSVRQFIQQRVQTSANKNANAHIQIPFVTNCKASNAQSVSMSSRRLVNMRYW